MPLPHNYYNYTIPEHLEDLSLDDSLNIKYAVKCGSTLVPALTLLSIRTSGKIIRGVTSFRFVEGNPLLTDRQVPSEGGISSLS